MHLLGALAIENVQGALKKAQPLKIIVLYRSVNVIDDSGPEIAVQTNESRDAFK